MSNRENNIDHLFNEVFKDFENIPSNEVWMNIEKKLDKDRDIDLIFYNSFNGQHVIVPERLWNNVEKELDREKKYRITWYKTAIVALIILLPIPLYLWYSLAAKKPDSNIETSRFPGIKDPKVNTSIEVVEESNKIILNKSSNVYNAATNKKRKTKETSSLYAKRPIAIVSGEKESIHFEHKEVYENQDLKRIIKEQAIPINENQVNIEYMLNITASLLSDEPIESSIYQSIIIPQKEYYVKQPKYFVNGYYSSNYSYRNLIADKNNFWENYAKQLDEHAEAKRTNGAGINVGYNISDKWSIYSGINYTEKGYITNIIRTDSIFFLQHQDPPSVSFTESPQSGQGLPLSSDTLVTSSSIFPQSLDIQNNSSYKKYNYQYVSNESFKYLEIPIAVQYNYLKKNKMRGYASIGISLSFLTYASTLVKYSNYPKNEFLEVNKNILGNYQRINCTSLISLGFEYKIKSNLGMYLEPVYQRSLTPANKPGPIDIFHYSLSIRTGINYIF